MTCTQPVYIKLVDLWVPCGRCLMCRIQRTREWAERLIQQLSIDNKGVFVTLTYNDDHYPSNGSLDKKEIQKWMKRLRKSAEGLGIKIKYYACGEYGEEGGRAHYHAIVLGLSLSKEDKELIEKSWTFGFVKIGSVTYDSCRYVAEYISKGLQGGTTVKQLQLDGKEPPFALMSKGIGKDYVEQNKKQLLKELGVLVGTRKTGLPRYYRKILGITTEQLAVQAKEKQEKEYKRLLKQTKKKEDAIFPRVISEKRQRLNNVVAKKRLNKSRDPGSAY